MDHDKSEIKCVNHKTNANSCLIKENLIWYIQEDFLSTELPYPIVNPSGHKHYTHTISFHLYKWYLGYKGPRISKSRRHLLYQINRAEIHQVVLTSDDNSNNY